MDSSFDTALLQLLAYHESKNILSSICIPYRDTPSTM
jgi:hypothetical protein